MYWAQGAERLMALTDQSLKCGAAQLKLLKYNHFTEATDTG